METKSFQTRKRPINICSGLGVIWSEWFDTVIILGCVEDDNKMSSSRYWPPTSPEDLKRRAEETSVCLLTARL
jgi:hypothetical protein